MSIASLRRGSPATNFSSYFATDDDAETTKYKGTRTILGPKNILKQIWSATSQLLPEINQVNAYANQLQ